MKGILFNHQYHMWHAVLAGNKTQTRRAGAELIQINSNPKIWHFSKYLLNEQTGKHYFVFKNKGVGVQDVVPYYQPGEVVYLKEPVIKQFNGSKFIGFIYNYAPGIKDMALRQQQFDYLVQHFDRKGKWGNKLFMPKEAARHYVKITGVRVQRLNDTPDADIVKEGLCFLTEMHQLPAYYIKDNVKIFFTSLKRAYLDLFKKVGKKMVTPNPWLFVYDFVLCNNDGTQAVVNVNDNPLKTI